MVQPADFLNHQPEILEQSEQPKLEPPKKSFLATWKFLILVILLLLVLTSLGTLLSWQRASKVYEQMIWARDDLQKASNYLQEQNFGAAVKQIDKARDNFTFAKARYKKFKFLSFIPWLGRQSSAIDNLLEVGIQISEGLKEASLFADNILTDVGRGQPFNFEQITSEQKREILEKLIKAPPILEKIEHNIILADQSVNQIQQRWLLGKIKKVVIPLQERLGKTKRAFEVLVPISKILPQIAGYPEPKTYLFLFQNNDELRPTGGFIGTYGLLKIKDAELTHFETQNVYQLDNPVEGILKEEPPAPIKKYLKVSHWYMRDANWSPDFPEAAKRVEWFYQTETRLAPKKELEARQEEEKIDGVISITPTVIESLIKLTGPIEAGGVKFSAENLIDTLQYHVEQGYVKEGISEIQRKAIVGTLANKLIEKLFQLPSDQWLDVASILKRNLEEKHILIYSKDRPSQQLIYNQDWGGQVKEVAHGSDYLMVIDSNLASLKTDSVMERKINYTLKPDAKAKVTITYYNKGPFTWKTTRYRTYTRVLAPLGSKLIEAKGQMEKEKSPAVGKVEVGEDLNKTYFAAFISIEPGETKNLSFEYQLPESIKKQINLGEYNLLVQKQSGTRAHDLILDLNFDKKIRDWQPTGFGVVRQGKQGLKYVTDLRMDREFEVKF